MFNEHKIFKFKSYKYGNICFNIGLLLLALTPFYSAFFLLISLIISTLKNWKNFLKDKWNYPLLVASILMILSTLKTSHIDYYGPELWDPNLSWLGMLNWVPFFWAFWGFQIYLKTPKLRKKAAKLLSFSSIVVIITGLGQYFFDWFGPFTLLNNTIILYQRPILEGDGLTGLFNNQNYAGSWLLLIFPLVLAFAITKKTNFYKDLSAKFFSFAFLLSIFLTNSRNAIFSSLLSIFLLIKLKGISLYLFLSIVLTIFLSISFFNYLPKLIKKIFEFLFPNLVFKLSNFNLLEITKFPRNDIWVKAIDLIIKKPFFGWGAASFSILYQFHAGTSNSFKYRVQHTHNIFLELAQNYGILVAIIFLGFMIFLMKNLLEINLDSSKNIIDKAWMISVLLFLISHLSDITIYDGRINILVWIFLSGAKCMIDSKKDLNLKET